MKNSKISIICAMDEKRGIGKNNQLLFKIPEDFKRMKQLTVCHPIIMGRKTFGSIGRVLPNRTNIVITRDKNYKIEGAVVVYSLDEGLRQAQDREGSDEIFIFGGGEIFRQVLENGLVDKLYLTIVEGDYTADIFFPDYSEFKKKVFEQKGESGEYRYVFLELEK